MDVAALPKDAWIEQLLGRHEAETATRTSDGRVVVTWGCALTSVAAIEAVLGATFERVFYEEEDMFDGDGESVDVESVTRVDACADRLAILESHDHWQAAFSGTLTVHPNRAAYDAALARALAAHEAEDSW